MTKFEELLQSYEDRTQKHLEYKNDIVQFACDLFERFVQYLECPPERIRFYPHDADGGRGEPTPQHAMTIKEDGRIVTVVLLEIRKPNPSGRRLVGQGEKMILPTYFGKTGNRYTVQVDEDGKRFTLASAADSKADQFFDHILDVIKRIVRDSYKLEHAPQTLGFRMPEN